MSDQCASPVLNPCGIPPAPNSCNFTGLDYSFLNNCSEALLLLSVEERAFSCSENFFFFNNKYRCDIYYFWLYDRVYVLLDLLNMLPRMIFCMPVHSLVWMELLDFWTFFFLSFVSISASILSVWLSSLTSVRIEAYFNVIWSYLLPLVCTPATPASVCSSSALCRLSLCVAFVIVHHFC